VKEAFLQRYPDTSAHYASKAFLSRTICRLIEEEGLGLDVVSGGELYIAMSAGFPMERVVFHGNNKSEFELERAISAGVGKIVVDNLHELEMIAAISRREKRPVKILFRIAPGLSEIATHAYITTGQKDTKFGIPLVGDAFEKALVAVDASPWIDLVGLHFHVGSQLKTHAAHLAAIEATFDLLEKQNIEIEELNVGGGFGIVYTADDEGIPLSYFTDAIMDRIETLCKKTGRKRPHVSIEPGRWLIGEAGITLYEIGAVKEIPGIRTYVSVDGGMPDNVRPALYNARYSAIIANRADQPTDRVVTIAGKTCESGDILIWDLAVPEVAPGDLLAVYATGAYGYSMASNYNQNLIPAVVMVSEGQHDVIVRRQTFEDLVSRDELPERFTKKERTLDAHTESA
jgi:diaminopimelate decarboxylase